MNDSIWSRDYDGEIVEYPPTGSIENTEIFEPIVQRKLIWPWIVGTLGILIFSLVLFIMIFAPPHIGPYAR